VEVKVTTAAGGAGAWLKGSSGFTILPISKCPGYNKCKASSQIPDFPTPPKVNETALARANATKQPTELDANGPLFFAVNPPAGMPGNFHSGGRMCAASNQGYQCSISAAQGVTIHYSYGGHAPVNVCTNKTGAERAARNSSTMMHFAIQTQQLVRMEAKGVGRGGERLNNKGAGRRQGVPSGAMGGGAGGRGACGIGREWQWWFPSYQVAAME
jgi:hypothetical protein